MAAIHFKTTLYTINGWTILHLPKEASAQLPSRGQTMVKGTVNGVPFQTPLEPDGDWNHWFSPDTKLLAAAKAGAGDTIEVTLEPTKDWPEPIVPADLQKALDAHPKAYELWQRITPMARWEWIRWSRGTISAETRAKRIAVACSKLESGMRRPCCWNRNLCSEPEVSKSGLLLQPTVADT
ncbi:MAG TPA: YdeI/OmpD-associated family protein [Candidatus Saccharimonadales bacterium]|nr:YdeI/OmpD-associated family protein [Candidatus Saccharimonadales bacterium]